MKEPLRMPLEATGPDLVGPRLVHETGGDDRQVLPGFCAELREARLRGGYSLSDAAHVLRIQEHYLEALEEGRFDQIPGTTYIIGFLRSYSGFLGLDPDEIIDAFKREQRLDTREPRLAFPSPSDSSPKPKFWLILLVLVLAGPRLRRLAVPIDRRPDRDGPRRRRIDQAHRGGRPERNRRHRRRGHGGRRRA